MWFENEHVRAKSRARSAAPLSDNGPVQSTVRQDQRVRVRIGQQTVPERMWNETGELRVSLGPIGQKYMICLRCVPALDDE